MAARLNRIPPLTIAADRSTLLALQGLNDYQPLNNTYSVATIQQYEASLTQAEQAVIRAQEALDHARAVEIEAAHVLHNAVIGARQHVIAQYGPDAAAVQIVGLTRKSDYKRPTRCKAIA